MSPGEKKFLWLRTTALEGGVTPLSYALILNHQTSESRRQRASRPASWVDYLCLGCLCCPFPSSLCCHPVSEKLLVLQDSLATLIQRDRWSVQFSSTNIPLIPSQWAQCLQGLQVCTQIFQSHFPSIPVPLPTLFCEHYHLAHNFLLILFWQRSMYISCISTSFSFMHFLGTCLRSMHSVLLQGFHCSIYILPFLVTLIRAAFNFTINFILFQNFYLEYDSLLLYMCLLILLSTTDCWFLKLNILEIEGPFEAYPTWPYHFIDNWSGAQGHRVNQDVLGFFTTVL